MVMPKLLLWSWNPGPRSGGYDLSDDDHMLSIKIKINENRLGYKSSLIAFALDIIT